MHTCCYFCHEPVRDFKASACKSLKVPLPLVDTFSKMHAFYLLFEGEGDDARDGAGDGSSCPLVAVATSVSVTRSRGHVSRGSSSDPPLVRPRPCSQLHTPTLGRETVSCSQ